MGIDDIGVEQQAKVESCPYRDSDEEN